MKMDEYLKRKQELQNKQKEFEDKRKELEEAKKKAKELEEAVRLEVSKENNVNKNKFSLFGMEFRPWTLNDMAIILLIVGILVVGGVSFIPGGDVSADTDHNDEGFFARLFGGFTVKSIDKVQETTKEESSEEDIETETGSESQNESEDNPSESGNSETVEGVDFGMKIEYQDSPFTTMNISNVDSIWYALTLSNSESYTIKCNVKHYVNNNLKNDESTILVEAGNPRIINIRELASDTVNTESRVRLEVSCSDGVNSATQNTKAEHLKFYFN